jgi:ABC-type uncharacterized transport system ATPase subunit
MLADNLSVLENVILGAEPSKRGMIDFPEARRQIIELGEDYGLKVGTRDLVEKL